MTLKQSEVRQRTSKQKGNTEIHTSSRIRSARYLLHHRDQFLRCCGLLGVVKLNVAQTRSQDTKQFHRIGHTPPSNTNTVTACHAIFSSRVNWERTTSVLFSDLWASSDHRNLSTGLGPIIFLTGSIQPKGIHQSASLYCSLLRITLRQI